MIFFPKMFKIHFKIQINTRGPNIYIYIYIYIYIFTKLILKAQPSHL